MRVHLAADHAGFALKERVKEELMLSGYEVVDHGAAALNPDDDYPDFVAKAAQALDQNPSDRALVFGGSGQGEAMVGNRYKNVRAAVFYGPMLPTQWVDARGKTSKDPFELVKLFRAHNDSNMLSLGVRFLQQEDALKAIRLWLEAPFSGDERHERRIRKF